MEGRAIVEVEGGWVVVEEEGWVITEEDDASSMALFVALFLVFDIRIVMVRALRMLHQPFSDVTSVDKGLFRLLLMVMRVVNFYINLIIIMYY